MCGGGLMPEVLQESVCVCGGGGLMQHTDIASGRRTTQQHWDVCSGMCI